VGFFISTVLLQYSKSGLDIRMPMLHLLIGLKLIQAFDTPSVSELSLSAVLSIFLTVVMFFWPV